MLPEFDLFAIFRWTLATMCTVYVVVVTINSLVSWLRYFATTRYTAVMGRYTYVLLLRIRIRRFASDLIQIVFLVVVFAAIVYAHYALV
jgi:hypothetical protein